MARAEGVFFEMQCMRCGKLTSHRVCEYREDSIEKLAYVAYNLFSQGFGSVSAYEIKGGSYGVKYGVDDNGGTVELAECVQCGEKKLLYSHTHNFSSTLRAVEQAKHSNVCCKACGENIMEILGEREMMQCVNSGCNQGYNFGLRGRSWRLRCPKCGDWHLKHRGSLSSYWTCEACGEKITTSPLTYC